VFTRGTPFRALLRAGILCLLGSAVSGAERSPSAHTFTVLIDSVQFKPQDLTVQRGDRIVWVNRDPIPHTVTADSKAFDSHSLAPEASWAFVAKKRGEYVYHCTLHPTMTGTIVVK
jgi:plastocyanin